jgi:hypothetical protein
MAVRGSGGSGLNNQQIFLEKNFDRHRKEFEGQVYNVIIFRIRGINGA